MPLGLLGRKCGMTRVFTDNGVSIPVTVIEITPNRITQIKTIENDGYSALQVTVGSKKQSHVKKPIAGHLSKANTEAGRKIREFRVLPKEIEEKKLGDELTVEIFSEGQFIDVSGVSKGKGFAGAVKRHNFRTQDATHGNSLSHRAPGSIGQCQTPGRVFKGKKMAGQLGNVKKTVQNQIVVGIDKERNLILVKGVVPGAPGGEVIIMPAVKKREKE